MEQKILPLSPDEIARLDAQRNWVREHLDPKIRDKYDSVEGKVNLLASILENRWVEAQEAAKLQCLGVTFGDALVQAMGLEWVAVQDEETGRTPALTLRGSNILVFPLTSISKRVEKWKAVDAVELFNQACATIVEMRGKGVGGEGSKA